MRIKSILTGIALFGILAIATNGLPLVHLLTCLEHDSDHGDSSSHEERQPHDNRECTICQILLVNLSKYTLDTTATISLIQYNELFFFLSCEEKHSQSVFSSCLPRGPPTA